jgi:hypothetical protein
LAVRLALAPPLAGRVGEASLGAAMLAQLRAKQQARAAQQKQLQEQKPPPLSSELGDADGVGLKFVKSFGRSNHQGTVTMTSWEGPKGLTQLCQVKYDDGDDEVMPMAAVLKWQAKGLAPTSSSRSSRIIASCRSAGGFLGPPVSLVLFHLTYAAPPGAAEATQALVQIEVRHSLTCPFCGPRSNRSGRTAQHTESSPEALLQHLRSHHGELLTFEGRRDRRDPQVFHLAVQRQTRGVEEVQAQAAAAAAAGGTGKKWKTKAAAAASTAKAADKAAPDSMATPPTAAEAFQFWSARGVRRRARCARGTLLTGEGGKGGFPTGKGSKGSKGGPAEKAKGKRAATAASLGAAAEAKAASPPNKRSRCDAAGAGAGAAPLAGDDDAAAAAAAAASARVCKVAGATFGQGAALPVRQYYHSRTGVPMAPHEMNDDSDDDIDDAWAVHKHTPQ